MNAEANDNTPVQVTYVEPASNDGALAKAASDKLDQRFRVHFHTTGRRLADPDGYSYKAALDGIVEAGILPDDTGEYIKEISITQEHGEEDQTIIEITQD